MSAERGSPRSWESIARELEAHRETQRGIWGDLDDLLVAKYFAGVCTDEEQRSLVHAMEEFPTVKELVEVLTQVLGPPGVARVPQSRLGAQSLVLAVVLAAARWTVEVRRHASWLGAQYRLTSVPSEARGDEQSSGAVVEFRDLAVKVAVEPDTTQIQVLSRTYPVEGLVVQAVSDDEREQLLDVQETDANGITNLRVIGEDSYALVIQWPASPTEGPDA